VSKFEPFLVKAKKVSHFPKREDNPIPIIAPIESKELDELHKKLANAFDSDKIEFNKTFRDYKPHITLAYSDDEFDDFKIDPPIEFIVNEVVLWGGDEGDDRVFITFPLKAPERTKHSALMRKIDMYEKLAMG
jgi:2'-5' RNA ligase